MKLSVGDVVEVSVGNSRRLGVAVRADGKKNWMVSDENGVSSSIAPKNITYVVGPPTSLYRAKAEAAGESDSGRAILAAVAADCRERLSGIDEFLEIAWEVIASRDEEAGGSAASLDELTEIVLDEATPESLYAMHVLLTSDRIFFKEKNIKGTTFYQAKSESLVQQAKASIEAEKAAAEERERELEVLRNSIHLRNTDALEALWGKAKLGEVKDALVELALLCGGNGRDSPGQQGTSIGVAALTEKRRRTVSDVLRGIGKPILPSAALDVLVAWGHFSPHENLALLRSPIGADREFEERFLEAASNLLHAEDVVDVDADTRLDLTTIPSYAIDSKDTTEVDDAISWDPEDGRIWVHVADVTRWFPDGPSHPLVAEALRRVATVYLVAQKVTMFPLELAERRLSLGGDASDGSALSVGFKILDSGDIDRDTIRITPSRIARPERMTYLEARDIIQNGPEDHDLCTLHALAQRHLEWRKEDGAVFISTPLSRIQVSDMSAEEPEIEVIIEETDGPDWTTVSELMIVASSIAGDFAEEKEIPVMFRGQRPFDYPSEEALERIPDGPARAAAVFRDAMPSEVRSEPIEHASLALDAYTQITSPIRRSADLIAHFQIKSALRGEDLPFDIAGVNLEISRSQDRGRLARSLEVQTTKYWMLEYLRRLGANIGHEGVFTRPLRDGDARMGLVHLTEFAYQLVVQLPPGTEPGTTLAVRVLTADPRNLFSKAVASSWAAVDSDKLSEGDLSLDEMFSDVSLAETSD